MKKKFDIVRKEFKKQDFKLTKVVRGLPWIEFTSRYILKQQPTNKTTLTTRNIVFLTISKPTILINSVKKVGKGGTLKFNRVKIIKKQPIKEK